MAESTGLLNLHTGNRITSSNLVLSAQCKASGTLHECAAFLRLWVSPSRARSRKEMPMNAKRALWARSLMLCSRTHRDVAAAGGQISSESIPSPLLRLSAKVSLTLHHGADAPCLRSDAKRSIPRLKSSFHPKTDVFMPFLRQKLLINTQTDAFLSISRLNPSSNT